METCKVEFTNSRGQKIILNFYLDEIGNLEYKPSFKPKIVDPKTNLGLAGKLCEMFITTIVNNNESENIQSNINNSKRILES